MTTTRAAKYLAPIDLGKTITVTDTDTGHIVTGELTHIDAIDCSPIGLTIIAGKYSGHYLVEHDDEITLAGQPSPPTDDPHGSDQAPRAEQLPAPIPAAQAADDAELGIRPGPVCCIGDCCGPGSYCCKHPHNYHEHDDEPDHAHVVSYQDAEHCILCDEVLQYDENGNRL